MPYTPPAHKHHELKPSWRYEDYLYAECAVMDTASVAYTFPSRYCVRQLRELMNRGSRARLRYWKVGEGLAELLYRDGILAKQYIGGELWYSLTPLGASLLIDYALANDECYAKYKQE